VRAPKVIAIAAVAVLAALVASAITLAANGTGAVQVVPSHLVVGPGPPATATGVLTFTSSAGVTVTADCALDFAKGAADVTATASLSIVTATVEARLVDATVYLNVQQFASLIGAPWISTGSLHGPVRLDALATALRHPDLTTSHAIRRQVAPLPGHATRTTLSFGTVHLPSTAHLPIVLPRVANVTAAVITGSQGQVLSIEVHLANPVNDVRLTFQVTGYDVPVSIAPPPEGEVAPLTNARAQAIFGTDAGGIVRRLGELRRAVARLG
jgi:hypothetical protein